ncbi:hypothetical protein AAFF_G00115880 [Aldrovandia affinis]|uniref:Integrase p58-like C-terminal domain-containing protein n=1 Tax=Aldrovandia affinis TaxID=143900 RepID=A0AAD7T1E1_9TELE|nr:hypothetical protein AAFF_G00115880 [Aldrovandia affinis]
MPLVLWTHRTAVQESSQCTPDSLLFGRELRTPVGGPEVDYLHRLQEHLRVGHDFTRQAQAGSGVRQKRVYNTRCRDQVFAPGDRVWIFCPSRTKGVSPKLRSPWRRPGEVLQQLSEVVYQVRMPGRGREVVLHQDWLAP